MRAGEADELGRVPTGGLGHVEALEVHVERGPVVERVDAVALALGHQHGVADPAPAVMHADPERGVGADREGDDRIAQDFAPMHLEGVGHGQVIAGAAADERDHGAGDVVGAADDVALVAGEAVGQQHQGLVRPLGEVVDAGRDFGAGLAQAPGEAGRGGAGHDEAFAAERHHDDAPVGRAARTDLARGRAADQRHVAGRDAVEHRLDFQARAREHDQGAQIRAAVNGRGAGFGPGAERIRVGRLADPYPASSSHHIPDRPQTRALERASRLLTPGHQNVVRPPIVARSSSVLQRGQARRGCGGG